MYATLLPTRFTTLCTYLKVKVHPTEQGNVLSCATYLLGSLHVVLRDESTSYSTKECTFLYYLLGSLNFVLRGESASYSTRECTLLCYLLGSLHAVLEVTVPPAVVPTRERTPLLGAL